jgi:hypothetical protein
VLRGLEGERGGGEEGKRCQEAQDALAEGGHVKAWGRGRRLRRDEAAVCVGMGERGTCGMRGRVVACDGEGQWQEQQGHI